MKLQITVAFNTLQGIGLFYVSNDVYTILCYLKYYFSYIIMYVFLCVKTVYISFLITFFCPFFIVLQFLRYLYVLIIYFRSVKPITETFFTQYILLRKFLKIGEIYNFYSVILFLHKNKTYERK